MCYKDPVLDRQADMLGHDWKKKRLYSTVQEVVGMVFSLDMMADMRIKSITES